MPNTRMNYAAFVPQGEDRVETARLLVRTADEHGIDQRSIQSTHGGFNITEELAEVLYDEGVADEDETETPSETEDETSEVPAEEPAEPAVEDETSKSVPATQSSPQSRKGKGDSKADKTSSNRAAKNTNSKEE